MLHYFPSQSQSDQDEGKKVDQDSWCGWHFDHGALTGLTSAMYLDKEYFFFFLKTNSFYLFIIFHHEFLFLLNSFNEVPCPDSNAGLYIKSYGGKTVKVLYFSFQFNQTLIFEKKNNKNKIKIGIPPDCLGFQMGEVMQVVSGGELRATEHCVRAAYGEKAHGISRNTLAVFFFPSLSLFK